MCWGTWRLLVLFMMSISWSISIQAASAWWEEAGHTSLAKLVEAALTKNENLKALESTRRGLEHAARAAGSSRLPQLSLNANTSISPTQSLGFQFGGIRTAGGQANAAQAQEIPAVFGNGSVALSALWQIDYAGRFSANKNALSSEAENLAATYDAQRLQLARQVTTLYLDFILGKAQLKLLEQQIKLNAQLLAVLEQRFTASLATAADVLQQRQSISALSSQQPLIEAAQDNRRQMLVFLTGVEDVEIINLLEQHAHFPAALWHKEADALLLHPRLVSLKAQKARADYELRASQKSRLPQLSLSGQWGIQGFYFDALNTQRFWGAGLNFSLPLFLGGQLREGIQQKSEALFAKDLELRFAELEIQLLAQQQHALLAGYAKQSKTLAGQVDTAKKSYQAAVESYQQGIGAFSAVILSNLNWFSAQNAVLQNTRARLEAELALAVQAGGAWIGDIK